MFLVFLIPILVIVFVAIFTPSNVLSMYPWVDAFVSGCEYMVPSIEEYARISRFPEVTGLILSITWAFVPIQVALLVIRLSPTVNPAAMLEHPFYFAFAMCVLSGIIFSVWYGVGVWEGNLHGHSRAVGVLFSMRTDRMSLALGAGFWISTVVVLLLTMVVVAILNLPKALLGKRA